MKDSEAASKYAQSVATPLYHFRFRFKEYLEIILLVFKSHYDYFVNKHKDKMIILPLNHVGGSGIK